MSESGKTVKNSTLEKIIFAIILVQIILGIVYLVHSFAYPIETELSSELETIARRQHFDEYTGSLYPGIVRTFLSLQYRAGIPYYVPIYLIQLSLCAASLFYLVRNFVQKKRCLLFWAAAFTFPLTLRTSLIINPYSFRLFLGIAAIAALIHICRNVKRGSTYNTGKNIKHMIVYLCSIALDVLCDSSSVILWSVVSLLFFINLCIVRKILPFRKTAAFMAAVYIVLAAATVGALATQDPGSNSKMQRSFDAVMLSRVAWPNAYEKINSLPSDLTADLDEIVLYGIDDNPDMIFRQFGPILDEKLGRKEANVLYHNLWTALIKKYPGDFLKNTAAAFAQYAFWPVSSVIALFFNNAAYTETAYSGFYIFFIVYMLISMIGMLLMLCSAFRGIKKKSVFVNLLILTVLHSAVLAFSHSLTIDLNLISFIVPLFMVYASAASLKCYDGSESESDNLLDTMSASIRSAMTVQRKRRMIKVAVFSVIAIVFSVAAYIITTNILLYSGYKKLSNQTILVFGDSIWGLETGETGIAKVLEGKTGANIINCAIPGSSAVEQDNDFFAETSLEYLTTLIASDNISAFPTVSDDVNLADVDWVILAYGLNDYFLGFSVQDYENSLSAAVSAIHDVNPDINILIIGQTKCQVYGNGVIIADSDTQIFEGGGYGYDYVQAAERVANKQGVAFLSMHSALNITKYNGTLYLTDATHLTEYGRKRYANKVAITLSEYQLR